MKVVIRADASGAVGSGHVMRCLALADALGAAGARVTFVTRALPSHLAAMLTAHGHEQVTLPLAAPAGHEAPQQAWPEALQHEDAEHTRALLQKASPDWLVVDHYGLDRLWETLMQPVAGHLLAIDDLAREHACDLLLDANFHEDAAARYAQAAAAGARLLLGPSHALLRPRFAEVRRGAAARTGPVRRLLVFMGGMDAGNATGLVLDALGDLQGHPPVDVVAGAGHPALPRLDAFCADHPGSRLHVQSDDMPGLLAGVDAAVGAGGSATWERCCLGVPTLALSLAENQAAILAPAAAAGLLLVPDGGLPARPLLAAHLQAFLHNTALRERISLAGMRMVDGRGAPRVVAAMMGEAITMRRAEAADSERLHGWRNAPAVREVSRTSAPIPFADHQRWLENVLRSPARVLLIGEDARGAVGVVRFDIEAEAAEVSIYVAEPRLGEGLGPGLLRAAERWLARERPEVRQLHAEVLGGNLPSARLFTRSGYALSVERYSKKITTP